MLASKPAYSAPLGMPTPQATMPSYHVPPQRSATAGNSQDNVSFTSPRNSEFADGKDGMDSVRYVQSRCARDAAGMLTLSRNWDEKKVISWLHTINCGQYEALFKGTYTLRPSVVLVKLTIQRITSTAIISLNAIKRSFRRWESRKLVIESAFLSPSSSSGTNLRTIANSIIW